MCIKAKIFVIPSGIEPAPSALQSAFKPQDYAGMFARDVKSLILIVLGLLLWRTIISFWQESEEPFMGIYLFTSEELLMIVHHAYSYLFTCEEPLKVLYGGRYEEHLKVLYRWRDEESYKDLHRKMKNILEFFPTGYSLEIP